MSTTRATPRYLKMRPISLAIVSLLFSAGANAWTGGPNADDSAAAVEFNDAFLLGSGSGRIDIDRFNKGNVATPGTYRVDLIVNENLAGSANVTLRAIGAGGDVRPCFDRELLDRVGIDLGKLTPAAAALLQSGACATLPELVEGATASFDNGEQRLYVSVPQVSMSRHARGYVAPEFWDEGVTAAQLQYQANTYSFSSGNDRTEQSYVGLNAGFNAGPWRLRHSGNLSHSSSGGTEYNGYQTYVQRSIPSLKSQLTLGDAFTDGAIFDSFGFRGVQLASDDRMYPESQRGYAPTVHGIANSNANVQIRQNGSIIYETTVAAGAFVIDDLYPTGYGGDLDVIVTEADGSVRVSKVPYAAPVNALRPGISRFSVSAGKFRSESIHSDPYVMRGTYQIGLTNLLTGYGGLVASDDYASAALGAAFNTRFGAIGVDFSQANTRLLNQPNRNGQSLRLGYSKLFAPTDTNISLAAYRYSTREYLSLSDAVALRELDDRFLGFTERPVQRGRLQLTLNQELAPSCGSFYVTGFRQDYWGQHDANTQFQAGYNNNFKRLTYGFSASRQFDIGRGAWDNQLMLSVSVPLGSGSYAPYSQTNIRKDSSGTTSLQESVTGTLGRDRAISYGVNASRSRTDGEGTTTTLGANAAYAAPYATFNGSASKSGDYRQSSFGMSGGVIAYGGGVVFTPLLGDTMAIVEAKGARGARLNSGRGLQIDRWGHAAVPSLEPFASNTIELNPRGLPLNVQLAATEERTVPTAGAITLVRFATASAGRAAILRARQSSGEPLPFGADVLDDEGQSVGTVAQAGRIIARNLPADSGELTAHWGDDGSESCRLSYTLPDKAPVKGSPYVFADTVCK